MIVKDEETNSWNCTTFFLEQVSNSVVTFAKIIFNTWYLETKSFHENLNNIKWSLYIGQYGATWKLFLYVEISVLNTFNLKIH